MSVAAFFLHNYLDPTWITGKNNLKRCVGEKSPHLRKSRNRAFCDFRLLLGGESAIIWLVSRKEILGTLVL